MSGDAAMAVDSNAMDIDMDIDLGLGNDDGAMVDEDLGEQNNSMSVDAASQPAQGVPDIYNEDITQVPTSVATKVHIRGLDELSTEDVEDFAAELFPDHQRTRLEWVDDTSANLVYNSPDIATDALIAFSDPTAISDPTASGNLPAQQLRPAKEFSKRPGVTLQIRQGLSTDVKKHRARDASRFYLMNPDKDPSNRPRRDGQRYGPRKRRHDEEKAYQPWDENMYDDDPVSIAARPRRNSDSQQERQAKRQRAGTARGTDLFADRLRGRVDNRTRDVIRARSASPRRDIVVDGRFGFEPAREAPIELFPNGGNSSNNNAPSKSADLFANRVGASSSSGHAKTRSRELADLARADAAGTPNSRASSPFHRRTDAFDIADERSHNSPHLDERHSRTLADRITGGPSPSRGRSRPELAQQQQRRFDPAADQGAAMRGVANASTNGHGDEHAAVSQRVRELFPQKAGARSGGTSSNGRENDAESGGRAGGADLFEDKLRGRRAPRRKAEDLFG